MKTQEDMNKEFENFIKLSPRITPPELKITDLNYPHENILISKNINIKNPDDFLKENNLYMYNYESATILQSTSITKLAEKGALFSGYFYNKKN